LDLGDDGDAVLNHVLPEAVGAFAKRVKEARVAESQALHREKMETCKAEAAWYLSSCTPNSGRWFMWRGGLGHRFQMSSPLFVDALRRRLLCPPTPLQVTAARHICKCPSNATNHPTHLLDCPRNQWAFERRHMTVCRLLSKFVSQVCDDCLVTLEVPLEQVPHPMRADIVVEIGARCDCQYV
jgi:hypothetical protein